MMSKVYGILILLWKNFLVKYVDFVVRGCEDFDSMEDYLCFDLY